MTQQAAPGCRTLKANVRFGSKADIRRQMIFLSYTPPLRA
jgi:hypothetical protein